MFDIKKGLMLFKIVARMDLAPDVFHQIYTVPRNRTAHRARNIAAHSLHSSGTCIFKFRLVIFLFDSTTRRRGAAVSLPGTKSHSLRAISEKSTHTFCGEVERR